MSLKTFLWIFVSALASGLLTFFLFEYFAPKPFEASRDGKHDSQEEILPEAVKLKESIDVG